MGASAPQPAGDTPWSGLLIRRRAAKRAKVWSSPYLVHCFASTSFNLLSLLEEGCLKLNPTSNIIQSSFFCLFLSLLANGCFHKKRFLCSHSTPLYLLHNIAFFLSESLSLQQSCFQSLIWESDAGEEVAWLDDKCEHSEFLHQIWNSVEWSRGKETFNITYSLEIDQMNKCLRELPKQMFFLGPWHQAPHQNQNIHVRSRNTLVFFPPAWHQTWSIPDISRWHHLRRQCKNNDKYQVWLEARSSRCKETAKGAPVNREEWGRERMEGEEESDVRSNEKSKESFLLQPDGRPPESNHCGKEKEMRRRWQNYTDQPYCQKWEDSWRA